MGRVLAFARVQPKPRREMVVELYPDEDKRYCYLKVIDPEEGHSKPARYGRCDVLRVIFEFAMLAERRGFNFLVDDHTGDLKVVKHELTIQGTA